jgi:hypothetical protein
MYTFTVALLFHLGTDSVIDQIAITDPNALAKQLHYNVGINLDPNLRSV